MKTVLIMDAERDGYTVNQVGDTMTVGDLRNFLNFSCHYRWHNCTK